MMPTYEYLCGAGHRFERFLSLACAGMKVFCPSCGKTGRKQMGAGIGVMMRNRGPVSTAADYADAGKMHGEMAKMDERIRKDK